MFYYATMRILSHTRSQNVNSCMEYLSEANLDGSASLVINENEADEPLMILNKMRWEGLYMGLYYCGGDQATVN